MDEKAAKKSLGPILIGLAAILIIVGVIWFFFIRGKGNDSQIDNNTSRVEDKTKVVAADLEKVDESVKFGDYTAMYTLSKAIQNGQKTGEVVKIDGQVSHKTSSYSVVQINPKKGEEGELNQIGTVFTIQDGESSDYPKDEERIEITAKVMEVSPLNFQLVTLKDFVKVIK